MKKILTHVCQQRTYFPLLQELSKHAQLSSGVLHNSIFDTYHKYKPDMVLLPIYEYTQEFHEFVDKFKNETSIVIFLGDIVHNDLIEYCKHNNIKTIRQGEFNDPHIVGYKNLYDSNIFINMMAEKNNKILVILSDDNSINQKNLKDVLYPATKLPIVAINNLEFHHPQNIGVANSADMAILFNKFGHLVDLSGLYRVEAEACGIDSIVVDENILSNIENKVLVDKESSLDQYEIKNFVTKQLLPFIGA